MIRDVDGDQTQQTSIPLRVVGSVLVVGAILFVTFFIAAMVGLASINFDPSATQTSGTGVAVVMGVIGAAGLTGIAASLRRIWRGFPRAVWLVSFTFVLLLVLALILAVAAGP